MRATDPAFPAARVQSTGQKSLSAIGQGIGKLAQKTMTLLFPVFLVSALIDVCQYARSGQIEYQLVWVAAIRVVADGAQDRWIDGTINVFIDRKSPQHGPVLDNQLSTRRIAVPRR